MTSCGSFAAWSFYSGLYALGLNLVWRMPPLDTAAPVSGSRIREKSVTHRNRRAPRNVRLRQRHHLAKKTALLDLSQSAGRPSTPSLVESGRPIAHAQAREEEMISKMVASVVAAVFLWVLATPAIADCTADIAK